MKTIKNQQLNIVDEDGTVVAIDQPVVKNTLNAHLFKKRYRKIEGVSQTVPDQTMSIREILSRHTSGGFPLPAVAGEFYEGEEGSGIDARSYDLSEAHEIIANAANVLSQSQEKMAKSKAAAKEAAEKKRIIDEYEKGKGKTDNPVSSETPSKLD